MESDYATSISSAEKRSCDLRIGIGATSILCVPTRITVTLLDTETPAEQLRVSGEGRIFSGRDRRVKVGGFHEISTSDAFHDR